LSVAVEGMAHLRSQVLRRPAAQAGETSALSRLAPQLRSTSAQCSSSNVTTEEPSRKAE
jgi:hypothetical protein